MGYEDAPATRMLATDCLLCGRPLVDALSVETGIGPICREKAGYLLGAPEEQRRAANALIHQAALGQVPIAFAVTSLEGLGFGKLAATVAERFAVVKIAELEDGRRLAVDTPYRPEVVSAMREIPGRRWDGEAKVNTFPASCRRAVWELLLRHFPGALGMGPKGLFEIA